MRVRAAEQRDAAAIAAIHNQGIAERQATFDTDERAAGEYAERIAAGDAPLLVAEEDGRVLGWAAVVPSSDRCAYSGVGEYTIYLDREARGRGIGAALLDALAERAAAAGYWKLIGRLFTTNEATIALARRCGFRDVGVHLRHGRLDGEWKDVLVVERLLD